MRRKSFYNRRAIHNRFADVPDEMTPQQCAFYCGATDRTVRNWLAEWAQLGGEPIAVQDARTRRWTIRLALLVDWLAAAGMMPESGPFALKTPQEVDKWLQNRRKR